MKKLESVQALRGCAALGVVLYHMLIIEKKYSGGDLLLPNIFKIGQSGVDLFFVISGFIIVFITIRSWGPLSKPGEFLIHRLTRIYPNYWFYFLITFLIFLLAPSIVNTSQGNNFNFLNSFLLLPSVNLPLVLVAWSLTYELFFYFVFAVFIQFNSKWVPVLLISWLLSLIVMHFIFRTPSQNAWIILIRSPYSIEFIFGALSGWLVHKEKLNRCPTGVFLFIIIAILLLIPVLFFRFYSSKPSGLYMQCLVFGPAFALILTSIVMIEKKASLVFPPILVKAGDVSYTIYLSHVLIMGAIGHLWERSFQRPLQIWDNLIIFPLMLVAIFTYSVFAYRVIEIRSQPFFLKAIPVRKSAKKLRTL